MSRLNLVVVQLARLVAKDWRLLSRDLHGLAVLFLMPAAFVLVMSFALKNTLVAAVEMPKTGWLLDDGGPAASQFARDWMARHGAERVASRAELLAALRERRLDAGVVVRASWLDQDGRPQASEIEVWLGNRVQPAAASRLRAELSFAVVQAQMKIAAAQAGPFASVLLESASEAELTSPQSVPRVRYLYEIESGRAITSVQQSVPAWLIFGMFFVVVPISGVLIQERNDGTLARMATFGVGAATVLAGKLIAFMLLNLVQLVLMLVIGWWLVPVLGGHALSLDVSLGWLALMVAGTSAAAVSLGLLVAATSRSFEHAAALGGGLNVILGAVAGVMVPRILMPSSMQTVSEWSPMGWALDGMQSVFLGDPDPAFILPRAALLSVFAGLCLLLSWRSMRSLGHAG